MPGPALYFGEPSAARHDLAQPMVGLDRQFDIRVFLHLPQPRDRRWREAPVRLLTGHAALAPLFEIEIPDAMAIDALANHQAFTRELVGIGCRVTMQSYGMGRETLTQAAAAATVRLEARLLRWMATLRLPTC